MTARPQSQFILALVHSPYYLHHTLAAAMAARNKLLLVCVAAAVTAHQPYSARALFAFFDFVFHGVFFHAL